MIGTDAPPGLLYAELIDRLVEDAGRIAKFFVGVPRDEWAPALVEILRTTQRGLDFLPLEIAQLVSDQFIVAVIGHAGELESVAQGRLQ